MSSLGEAVIDIGANTAGFRSDVERGVNSSLSSASKSMKNLGKGMSDVGAKMTLGVTAPLVGAAAAAVNTAGQFESTMNVLQAATGMGEDAMAAMEKQAITLGASTVFSANEAAEAMLELGKSGFSTAQITAAVPEVMNLAATEGLGLAQSAGIVSSALSQFALDADESGRVVNALAGASNASRSSVDSLAESMKLVGSAASGIGLTVEETAAALAALSDNGLDGSVAGTSLAAVFNKLVPQTDAARSAMQGLGLDFTNARGEFDSIDVIAQKLQDSFQGMDAESRKVNLSKIFGNDASTMAAVNALMATGADGMRDYTKAASDQDAANSLAEARMKGVQGAVEAMKGSLETAGLVLGQALIPYVTKAADTIGALADRFSNLSPKVQKFVLIGGAIAAAIGPVLLVVGALISAVGTIAGVFAGVTAAVAAPVAVFALLAVGIGLLLAKSEAARAVVSGAFQQIKTAVMGTLGPVKDMITGQLIPAFMQMWPIIEKVGVIFLKVFAGAVVGAVKGVMQVVKGVVQVITGVVQVVSGVLTGDWRKAWDGVKNIVSGVLNTVIGIIKTALNVGVLSLFRKGFQLLVSVVKGGWNLLRSGFSAGVSGIRSLLSRIANILLAPFRAGFSVVRGAVAQGWSAIRNGFSTGISAAVNLVRGLPGKIANVISGAVGALREAGGKLIGGLVAGITDKIGGAVDAVKNGLGKIKGLLPGSPIKWGPLKSWNNGGAGKRLMGFLRDGITASIPGVVDSVIDAAAAIQRGFATIEVGPAVSQMTSTFDKVLEEIEAKAQATFDKRSASANAFYKTALDAEKSDYRERRDLADTAYKKEQERLRRTYSGEDLRRRLADLRSGHESHLKKLEKSSAANQRAIQKEQAQAIRTLEKQQASEVKATQAKASAQKAAILQIAAAWDTAQVALSGVSQQLDAAMSDLVSKTDEMRGYAKSVGDSLISSVFGKDANSRIPASFGKIVQGLEQQEAKAAEFADTLATLRTLGLNELSYDQIVGEGLNGLEAAKALIAAGKEGVNQVNAIQERINTQAARAGDTAAEFLYGAGVTAAQGVVDGLAQQENALKSQMEALGQSLADALTAALGGIQVSGTTGAVAAAATSAAKHAWTPVSKSNRKCSLCGKARSASIHTNSTTGHASGSLGTDGGWARVGERGPELVRLPAGSRVYPTRQTERIESGGNQPPAEIHVHMPTGDPEAAAMATLNRLARRR